MIGGDVIERLEGGRKIRHEDDTGESALYSDSFAEEATVSLAC